MTAHSYWRVFVHLTNGIAASCNMAEIEFRDSGGTDLTGPGLGTASTTGGTWLGNVVANAFDNDVATSYQSNTWYNFAVSYQFNTPADVASAAVTSSSWAGDSPRHLSLDYSDDGFNWTRTARSGNFVEWTSEQTRTLPLASGSDEWEWYFGRPDVVSFTSRTLCDPNTIALSKFTLSEDALVTALIVNSNVERDVAIKGAIYAATGPSGYPQALIATTDQRVHIPANWFRLDFSPSLSLSAGPYWLCVHADGLVSSHTASNAGTNYTLSRSYALGPPDPFPSSGTSTLAAQNPIYALYYPELTPVTGTGANTLATVTSAGAGTFSGRLAAQVALIGNWRPHVALNATWVPRL